MFRRVLLAAVLSTAFVTVASADTVSYSAKLTGAKEVPKTTSKGTGMLDATFDTQTKMLKYTLTFDGLSGPATAAHIHGPAKKTENAGVVAPLGEKSPTSPVTGSLTLTDDQAKLLKETKLYVNVHTAANPGGEIRGPIYHSGHKAAAAKTAAPAKATTAPAAGK
jgi:hypothetical protein